MTIPFNWYEDFFHGIPLDLWRKAIDTTGARVLKSTWQSLNPKDSWQDYYQKSKTALAAETNFWSSFGGQGLAPGS